MPVVRVGFIFNTRCLGVHGCRLWSKPDLRGGAMAGLGEGVASALGNGSVQVPGQLSGLQTGTVESDVLLTCLTYAVPFAFAFAFYGAWLLSHYGWLNRVVHVCSGVTSETPARPLGHAPPHTGPVLLDVHVEHPHAELGHLRNIQLNDALHT